MIKILKKKMLKLTHEWMNISNKIVNIYVADDHTDIQWQE